MRTASGTPEFLGHCLASPKPTYEPKWKPVFSSWAGEMMPDDKLYQGNDVKLILPLSQFNMTTLAKLANAPTLGRDGLPEGTESFLDIGKLLQRNAISFELWLKNGFFNTANAAAYPDLDIGRYFVCCNTVGFNPDSLARDTEQVQLMIEANWVQAWPEGSRFCYSKDPAYFATLPALA